MTLRAKQSAFAKALGQLITYAYAQGYELTMADGSVDPVRRYRTKAGAMVYGEDANHMAKSLHYIRLAQDINLFLESKWITDGGHPAWTVLGTYWEALHPDAAWGGRFASVDSNHFSFRHGGKS